MYPDAHGGLNVVNAPEVSCNSFFYEVGYDLGLDENGEYSSDLGVKKIKKYAEEFGLGETTGIEIPESSPQISDTASVPTAIGQGTKQLYSQSVKPLCCHLWLTKGTVYKLSLLDKVTDIDGNVVKEYEPEVVNTMDDVSTNTEPGSSGNGRHGVQFLNIRRNRQSVHGRKNRYGSAE